MSSTLAKTLKGVAVLAIILGRVVIICHNTSPWLAPNSHLESHY
jgi:hypothetical protein